MDDWSIFDDAAGPAVATDDWSAFEDAMPNPSAATNPAPAASTPEDFDYLNGDLSQTEGFDETSPEWQAQMAKLQEGWRDAGQPIPEAEQELADWRNQLRQDKAVGELPPDPTELERLTFARRKELITGDPSSNILPLLQSAYDNETDPEKKRQRLVDLQVEKRRYDIRRAQLAGDVADIEWGGGSPDQKIMEDRYAVEAGLGPDMAAVNAPIMRGAMTGVANAASNLAEGALRILPGEGAPSQLADKIGRQRASEAAYQGFLDEKQGPVVGAINSAVKTIAEFASVSAAGGAAGLGVKGSSLLSALFSSSMTANDAYLEEGASDAHALGSAVVNGLLTYAGGRLGGGTWQELFGGQIGARTASKLVRSYFSELGEEFGQNYAQIAINRGYGIGNQNLPTWKENLHTLAVATLAQGAGEVIAGNAGNGSQSSNAFDFMRKTRPSRKDAEAAGLGGLALNSQERATMADQTLVAVAQKVTTESVKSNPQGTEQATVEAEFVDDAREPSPQQQSKPEYTDADEEILTTLTKRLKRQLRAAGFRQDEMGVTVENFQSYFRDRGYQQFRPGVKSATVTTNAPEPVVAPQPDSPAPGVPIDGQPAPQSTANPPGPTTPPDPMQAAAGIPISEAHASWLRRMFVSGGNQNEGVRSMVFKRDSVLRKHAAELSKNNRDLMREAKKAFGSIDDSVTQQLDEALKDPAVAAQLPPEVGAIIQDMRLHIDELSDQIQALGDTSAELFLTIDKNKGVYVTRTYKKFSDPEGWAAIAMKDPVIMGDFAAEVRQSSPNATDQDILTLAERLLRRQTMSNADLAATGSRTNAYVNVLKKRKDLSQAIRQLYGENKNAFTNYVETIERMSSLVAHKAFIENLKADGLANGYFSDSKTLTPGHVQEVAHGTHRQLEGLKGVFMEPELATAINDLYAMPAVNGAAQFFAGLSSTSKAMKTVFSPKSWVRNFLGNPAIAVANGHWSFSNFGRSANMTWSKDLFGRGDAAAKAQVKRLKELGVIEGVHMEALRDAAQQVTAATRWFAGLDPQGAAKKTLTAAARGYQAQDTIWKLHGYFSELDVLTRAYPGKPTHELEEMAARRIRAITPTYSEASRAAKFWARYVPIGPFSMFPAEIIRTTGNRMRIIAEDAKSGNPALRIQAAKRAAGQVAALGMASAIAAASRKLLGVSDDQDEAVRDRLADWSKNSPIAYVTTDADGMPREYLDLGFTDPFGVFTKPAMAIARGKSDEALGELSQPFTSDDIFWGTMVGLRYNRDENGRPIWSEGLSESEQNRQLMSWTFKRLEPGGITSGKRIMSAAGGETTASGQEMSLAGEAVSLFAGTKMQVLDRQTSDYFRNKEFNSRVQESNSAIRKAFLKRGTVGMDELESIYRSANDTRQQTMQKWKKYMDGSIKLGETQPLAKVVQDVGQASDTIKLMWAGNYVPYVFPEKDLRAMLRLPDGQARYDLWRRLHEEATTNAAAPRPEDPTP